MGSNLMRITIVPRIMSATKAYLDLLMGRREVVSVHLSHASAFSFLAFSLSFFAIPCVFDVPSNPSVHPPTYLSPHPFIQRPIFRLFHVTEMLRYTDSSQMDTAGPHPALQGWVGCHYFRPRVPTHPVWATASLTRH